MFFLLCVTYFTYRHVFEVHVLFFFCNLCEKVILFQNKVFLLFSFFWLCHPACRILVPWPGIEPVPVAVETQNPNLGPPENSLKIKFKKEKKKQISHWWCPTAVPHQGIEVRDSAGWPGNPESDITSLSFLLLIPSHRRRDTGLQFPRLSLSEWEIEPEIYPSREGHAPGYTLNLIIYQWSQLGTWQDIVKIMLSWWLRVPYAF